MNALGSLASDLATALDPVLLARAAGIEPDEWQAKVLRSVGARMLLNCCRQSGKSTITSVLAVHTALYLPESLILLLSPALRQSSELFKKCLSVYRALGRPVPAESETALTLTLENGSRIVALPGQEETIRGYSGVRLLCVDEASRVRDPLYMSIRPMLAVSGGRLLVLSTPWGRRGFFHQEWTEGGSSWKRVQITAEECPRITREFLAEERRSMPPRWFRQEYGCSFEANEDAAFDYDAVEAAFDDSVLPLFPVLWAPDTDLDDVPALLQ